MTARRERRGGGVDLPRLGRGLLYIHAHWQSRAPPHPHSHCTARTRKDKAVGRSTSHEDYWDEVRSDCVDGALLGRGEGVGWILDRDVRTRVSQRRAPAHLRSGPELDLARTALTFVRHGSTFALPSLHLSAANSRASLDLRKDGSDQQRSKARRWRWRCLRTAGAAPRANAAMRIHRVARCCCVRWLCGLGRFSGDGGWLGLKERGRASSRQCDSLDERERFINLHRRC
mgnify:FL=1